MCDEYYDAKTKAFWRFRADEDELNEQEHDELKAAVVLPTIEPPKAKPKPMLR